MFKIEFTASNVADIPTVAETMARIAAALGAAPVSHVQGVSVSDTPAKRSPGRPRKSADPVDAYVAAGGVMPTVTEIADQGETVTFGPPVDNAPVEIEEAEAAFVPEPPPATLESEIAQAEATFTPASLDELRAQIRTIAQDRGALWLRPLLEADKVTKVSGLTEATMRAALEAAQ